MKIQSGWHVVLDSRELKRAKPTAARRFGVDWVLWRDSNERPVAMRDRCPHRAAKLSLGSVDQSGAGAIRCPYHGITFDGQGKCLLVPELQRAAPGLVVQTLPCIEAHGFIWVWIGKPGNQALQPLWFANLDSRHVFSQIHADWPVHFSRWIENELDVTHLPFVHANTIGKGFDAAVPSRFEFDDTGILIFFDQKNPNNRIHQFAHFLYPALWQLAVSPSMFLVMAFVAVDEVQTKLYFRTYRSFGKLPLIRGLVSQAINTFNRKVLSQDKRVVLSQQPLSSLISTNEKLLKEDAAIRQYRLQHSHFVDMN
jgi:phenylpropionate dioxygenase-like ring-hydroxylating dioxygenase large terminal subunit